MPNPYSIVFAKFQRGQHFSIYLWWTTDRHCNHKCLPYPSFEWYITCSFSFVLGVWGLLLSKRFLVKLGFMVKMILRYSMVERFTARQFCGGFLYEEMAVLVNEEAEGLGRWGKERFILTYAVRTRGGMNPILLQNGLLVDKIRNTR